MEYLEAGADILVSSSYQVRNKKIYVSDVGLEGITMKNKKNIYI